MRKRSKPLFSYLAIIFTGIVFVLMLLIGYGSWYIYNQAKQQIRELADNNLKIYEQDIYVRLQKMRGDLQEIVNETVNNYFPNMDALDRYFANQEIYQLMEYKLNNNTDCSVFFMRNTAETIFLRNFETAMALKDKMAVETIIRGGEYKTRGILDENWDLAVIGGKGYLYQVYSIEGYEVGVFTSVDNLAHLMKTTWNESVEESFLMSSGKRLIFQRGKDLSELQWNGDIPATQKKGYITATLPIRNIRLRLTYFRKDNNFKIFFGGTQLLLQLTGFLCLLMTVLLYRMIKRKILNPIRELEKGAVKIEGGDYSYKVPEEEGSTEFDRLSRNFNSMTEEIVHLRIQEYEQKLEMKDREVRLLLAQIRPHFYLNAITTIQSMTWQNRNEDIRRYIDALSSHIRYMLQKGTRNVTLQQELKHVENYLKMQEIKLADSLFWMIECTEQLGRIEIPRLMIHTVIENSFKHAKVEEDMLCILIHCTEEAEPCPCVRIVMEDNGCGFPEEMLRKFREGKDIKEDSGFGLSNICRTLEILYDRKDLLHIGNVFPHGARVEISIPAQ